MFSFGVVLLELITGRKPVDQTRQGEESLVEWVRTSTIDASARGLSSVSLTYASPVALPGAARPRGRHRDGRPRRGGRPPAGGRRRRLRQGTDDGDGGGRVRLRPPLGSQAPADGAGIYIHTYICELNRQCWGLETRRRLRCSFVQVMRALDDEGGMSDLSNGVKVGQSRNFDSGHQQAAAIQQLRATAFASEEYTGEFEQSSGMDYLKSGVP